MFPVIAIIKVIIIIIIIIVILIIIIIIIITIAILFVQFKTNSYVAGLGMKVPRIPDDALEYGEGNLMTTTQMMR